MGVEQRGVALREPVRAQRVEHLGRARKIGLGVLDDAAEVLEGATRGLERRGHGGLDGKAAERPAPRNAHAAKVPVERREEGLARLGPRGRRARIGTRDRGRHQRGVAHRPRHRPEGRERVPGVDRGPVGHAPRRRTETDDVAETPRVAQARREVRSVRDRRHAACDRDARAAARPAAGPREVVGIPGRAEHRVEGLRAGTELRRVRLADHDRARGLHAGHDETVLRRDVVPIDGRAHGRAHPRRRHEVFHDRRQAEEGASSVAAGEPRVGLSRCGARAFGIEGHDRVDRRIHAADLSEVGVHHFGDREVAGLDPARELRGL